LVRSAYAARHVAAAIRHSLAERVLELPMTALLGMHLLLILFALRRGWRVAPFVLLALTPLTARLIAGAPSIQLMGWLVSVTTLTGLVGLLATASLLYIAVVDPERA
jgi:hypothetical protein